GQGDVIGMGLDGQQDLPLVGGPGGGPLEEDLSGRLLCTGRGEPGDGGAGQDRGEKGASLHGVFLDHGSGLPPPGPPSRRPMASMSTPSTLGATSEDRGSVSYPPCE